MEKWEQKVRAVGVQESERRRGVGEGGGGNTCQPSRSERGECFSKLGADVGLLGVFIDLPGF